VSGGAAPRDARWPAGLLLAFAALIGFLPGAVRPASPPDDCGRGAASDLAAMERCAALRGDDVELLLELGSRLEKSGDVARAEKVYRQAIEADPHDGEAHLRLGSLLLARGDRAGARQHAASALTTQPGNPAAIDLARRAGAHE
jgi:tetratricopeptide (TPR) repeat protein